MAYRSSGAIVLTPQRALIDASKNEVLLTLAGPGSEVLGKVIVAVAIDLTHTAQIAYEDPSGPQTHTFTEVGEAVWFYGATQDVWLKLSVSGPSTLTLKLDGLFGDGSDGNSTVSSNTTLSGSHVKYYESLTVNSSIELDTAERLICIRDSLTLLESSKIKANGHAGGPASTPGAMRAAAYYGGSSSGGLGGSNDNGNPGSSLSAAVGGQGGAGGDASMIYLGDSGGVLTAADYVPRLLTQILAGNGFPAGGSGGGGGGAEDFPVGGGGGGGAGCCVVSARRVVFYTESALQANGGAGSDPGETGSDSAGGGGGGGGGFVVLIYEIAEDAAGQPLTEMQVASYLEASGGLGGSGASSGANGTAGSAGRTLAIKVGAVL